MNKNNKIMNEYQGNMYNNRNIHNNGEVAPNQKCGINIGVCGANVGDCGIFVGACGGNKEHCWVDGGGCWTNRK